MEARTNTVEDWSAMIRDGLLTLPRFQRHEAWRPPQVAAVIENMLREPSLPIGALLILEVGDEELFHARPISGAPEPTGTPKMNLLDGQQRMTAIWRALNDNYDDFTAFVSLENAEQPEVKIVRRYRNRHGDRMPNWAENPDQCRERDLIPANTLLPGSKGEAAQSEWVKKACGNDIDSFVELSNRVSRLRQRIGKYQIPFLSLPVTTAKETAIDVFITMNTSSSPLNDFDIVVAQVEGADEGSLHDRITDLKEEVPTAEAYGNVESMALAVGALLLGKPALKSTYLHRDFGSDLPTVWDDVVRGIKRGVGFLRDETIFNKKLLPTEVIVNLTSALWANVPEDGTDEEGRARNLIRKTIWRACFTDRYEKTATTRTFADYKAILGHIKDSDSSEVPDLFDDDKNPLPEPEQLIQARWPSGKDRLGRAILAASLYGGGFDFADGAKASPDNVRSREYHHIYPKALVQEFAYHEINSALNCALISWKTNRTIQARSPRQYIEERARDENVTAEHVRQRLESHLIPYDMLMDDCDFQEFLYERAERIHDVMMKLTDGSIPQ